MFCSEPFLRYSSFLLDQCIDPLRLQCKLCIIAMRRVTFSLEEADHLALKLLAIHERKAMVAVVQEAIRSYLENKDAYLLTVTKGDQASLDVPPV
jgi:hypothetical protein